MKNLLVFVLFFLQGVNMGGYTLNAQPGCFDLDGAIEFFNDPLVAESRTRVSRRIADQYPNIPIEELTAIHHFTTNAHGPLNKALADGNTTSYQKAFAEILANGLSKLPNYNGTLFRGAPIPISTVLNKYRKAWLNSSNITENAFTSTTKNYNVAIDYADNNITGVASRLSDPNQTKMVKVVFTFKNPKSAKDISNISYFGPNGPGPNEFEVLFRNDSKFEVIGFDDSARDTFDNVIVNIELTEI